MDNQQEIDSKPTYSGFVLSKPLSSDFEQASASQDGANNPTLVPIVSATSQYRTYKRRWFGVVQLTLLNTIVSWDWLTFAPVSSQAAEFYQVSQTVVNWFGIAFMFANFATTPLTIWLLSRGLRPALITASILMLVGNWLRYAGSHSASEPIVPLVLVGQVLLGMTQSLVLSAPTRYSDAWFSGNGRVAATAVMSLANPFGAALGQLVVPFWAKTSSDLPEMVLYVSIMSTVSAVPTFFVPVVPPTPVGPLHEIAQTNVLDSLRTIATSVECYLIIVPFWILIGFFNGISSLLNQILSPYGFDDTTAGIGGGLLIIVGLVVSAITSPILDRTKALVFALKVGTCIGSLCYLALIWLPSTKSVPALYVVLSILGASSLSVAPAVLEVLIELSFPVGPEFTTTIAWAGGQAFAGCFALLGDAMKADSSADPPNNMTEYLIFQAVLAMAITPLPLCLGLFGRRDKIVLRRLLHQSTIIEGRQQEADESAS